MQCVVTDKNYYVISGAATLPEPAPDPATLYYRPYHMLSGYRTKAQTWLTKYDPKDYKANRTFINLDFNTAQKTTWASLGHENLDDNNAATTSPTASSERLSETFPSIDVRLSFIGLQAFDVDRGLWDIKRPRNLPLSAKAPSELRQPFYKTIKLLLGYAVDLTVTLPPAVTAADLMKQNHTISLLDIPITNKNAQGSELHVSLGDNAYPVLLAALAQEV